MLIEGRWFELLAIDGAPVAQLIEFSRGRYGELWQKRFDEDMVEVLGAMGRPVGVSLSLRLRDAASGAELTRSATLTGASRNALMAAKQGRSPAPAPPNVPLGPSARPTQLTGERLPTGPLARCAAAHRLLKLLGDKWQQIFTLNIQLPMGSVGMFKEKVTFGVPDPPLGPDEALTLARVFFVPEDLGTPPGGISLRGAHSFQTEPGWDTVYVPVFNMVERPVPPMLVIRVETDWFPHESEFRYILQPGDGITGHAHDADRPGDVRAARGDHARGLRRRRSPRSAGRRTRTSRRRRSRS